MSKSVEGKGQYSKLSGQKGHSSELSGEYMAKPHDPKEDIKRMEKILKKENDVLESAELALLDFAENGGKDALRDFLYFSSRITDMNIINSLITSLSPDKLAKINKGAIKVMYRELDDQLNNAEHVDEVSDLKLRSEILGNLYGAILDAEKK